MATQVVLALRRRVKKFNRRPCIGNICYTRQNVIFEFRELAFEAMSIVDMLWEMQKTAILVGQSFCVLSRIARVFKSC